MVNSVQDGEEKTIDFVVLDNGGKKLLNTISPDEPRHPSSLTKLLNENQVMNLHNDGHSA
jgi:D-alanyl-D-alanine carboxypeptidase